MRRRRRGHQCGRHRFGTQQRAQRIEGWRAEMRGGNGAVAGHRIAHGDHAHPFRQRRQNLKVGLLRAPAAADERDVERGCHGE